MAGSQLNPFRYLDLESILSKSPLFGIHEQQTRFCGLFSFYFLSHTEATEFR